MMNPWASGASYISVGGLRRALQVAETPIYNCLLINDEDNDEKDDSEICSSLSQIKFLKEIAHLDGRINELQKELQRNAMLSKTADLTDNNSIDSVLLLLEDLCSHLQTIMDNKSALIGRLQEAYEDHMTIDADFHSDTVRCFPLMAAQLHPLQTTLDSVTWTSRFSTKGTKLSSTCKRLSTRLAEIQAYFQGLEQSRSLMRSRLRKHQEEADRTHEQKIN